MKLRISIVSLFISALVGGVIGLMGGPAWMLIPWGVAGAIIGWFSTAPKSATANGAAYGAVLSFVFLMQGYTGPDPVISKLPGFVALAIFGGVCGAFVGLLGYLLRKLFDNFTHNNRREP